MYSTIGGWALPKLDVMLMFSGNYHHFRAVMICMGPLFQAVLHSIDSTILRVKSICFHHT